MGRKTVTRNDPVEGFPTAHGDEAAVDLRQLLGNLGPTVATVGTSPQGLDVTVGDPVIHDPFGGSPIEPGAIVLAVGTAPDSTEARELIDTAGRAGAAIVAFKMHDRDFRWTKEAEA